MIKHIFISFLLLNGASNTLSSQSFSDTIYYIQLTDIVQGAANKQSEKFSISQPDAPCMSQLIFSSDGQRFTVNSSDLKVQGHIKDDILLTNKITENDFYGLNKTMQVDFLDDFPFIYTMDNDLLKPLYRSKFSMTYENFRSEEAIAFFGDGFSAIQTAGNAKMAVKRHSKKSVSISNTTREVYLVNYKLTFEPTSAFLIDAKSEMKNLSSYELKRWFPKKVQSIWMFYDVESGRTLWKSELTDEVDLSNNWLFLDQAIKNKPDCGELGASNAYVYPNPSFGDFKLKIQDFVKGVYTFEIYNVIGKTLYSEPITVSTDSVVKQFRLKGLSKGTYLYSILDASGRRVQSKRLTIVGY